MNRFLLFFGIFIFLLRLPTVVEYVYAQPTPTNENSWTEEISRTKLTGALTQETLYDGTRPDILWQQYAIEVDWAAKWAEGIGQSLYYGKVKGKQPVTLLLTKEGRDWKLDRAYVSRALIASPQGSTVWWFDCNSRDWVKGMGP